MKTLKEKTLTTECIIGPVGSGKTEQLIQRIAGVLSLGVQPTEVLVFCATPSSVEALRARLQSKLGSIPSGLTITTHRSFALSMLQTSEAQAFTRRAARVLCDFEHNYLLEDMKTSGLKPRRLKEMLKFFYRGFTEMENHKQGWLIHAEEEQTFDLLQSYLAFYNGMLEHEISNLAVSFLQNSDEAARTHAAAHVFVDDYQNVCKASQMLSISLAIDSLCVAGNSKESLTVYESYPYAEGISEFCENFKEGVVTRLGESLNCPSTQAECFATIPDEFEGVTALIEEALNSGEYEPSDIFLVAPNKNWSDHLVRFLDAKDLSSDTFPYGQALKGDIRDVAKCSALRLYTALRLVAEPEDVVSWRCWCGFGDYLTQSNAVRYLKEHVQQEALQESVQANQAHALQQGGEYNFFSALTSLACTESELSHDQDKLLAAYKHGIQLIERCAGLCGNELLSLLAAELGAENGLAIVQQLADTSAESSTASEIVRLIEDKLFAPRFAGVANAIKIGPPESVCGLTPRLLIYTGFVNGFIPSRDYFDGTKTTLEKQAQLSEEYSRLINTTLGKARNKVILSYFEKSDLESAELLKLKVEKIRLEEGVRVCTITPSIYLEQFAN